MASSTTAGSTLQHPSTWGLEGQHQSVCINVKDSPTDPNTGKKLGLVQIRPLGINGPPDKNMPWCQPMADYPDIRPGDMIMAEFHGPAGAATMAGQPLNHRPGHGPDGVNSMHGPARNRIPQPREKSKKDPNNNGDQATYDNTTTQQALAKKDLNHPDDTQQEHPQSVAHKTNNLWGQANPKYQGNLKTKMT